MPNPHHKTIACQDEISTILHCRMYRIKDCLKESEIPDFEKALSQYHLDMAQLGKNIKLDQRRWGRFISALKEAIPNIVLRFISIAELSDLGVYGHAIASTNTLREALELSNHLDFISAERQGQGLRIQGNKVALYPKLSLSGARYVSIAEDAMAGSWRLLRLLLGGAV